MSARSPDPKFAARSPLSIGTMEVDRGTAVVALEGEIDLWSAPELKRTLCELVATGHKQLVLDAAGVKFMDSTALGVLVGVERRLAGDGRLVIAQPGGEVLRVLELSGVGASLQIFSTVGDAIVAVSGNPKDAPPAAATPLTTDAALLLGIASTAMPFAQSIDEQAERWLRALRRHGEAGALLASLGVQEAPVSRLEEEDAGELSRLREADPVAIVTAHAGHVAAARGATKATTTDVLVAVRDVYGETFARVLEAHGVRADELAERLANPPARSQPAS